MAWPWSRSKAEPARPVWSRSEVHGMIEAAMVRAGAELHEQGIIKLADRIYAPVTEHEARGAVWDAYLLHTWQRNRYECNQIASVAVGNMVRRALASPAMLAPAAFGILWTADHALNLAITPSREVLLIENHSGRHELARQLAGTPVHLLLI